MACLTALLWGLAAPAAEAGNPDYRMRTIETEHFSITYPAGQEAVADRAAMLAERAYDRVTQLLGHEVTQRTQVLITDSTDGANGSANALPFPLIRLNATAPGSMSVLDSFDDWLDILVTHEFVHVTHIDTVHGVPRLLNALLGFYKLGKVSAPNIVQPTWIIEGLATMYESHLSSAGRHRSAIFDMFLRMAVAEDRFQTIDRVTNGAKAFPHGSSVYLYGLHMMHFIATKYGHDKLAELSHIYGGRLLPFSINRALMDVLGVSYDELWEEFRQDATRRFEGQIRSIRAQGLRQGRRITFTAANLSSNQHTRYPFWSPDDRFIYFYDDDGQRDAGIMRVASHGAALREGVGIGAEGASVGIDPVILVEDAALGTWAGADGKSIVFGRAGTHDFRYGWHELYRWDGGDPEQREQLTFGLRAREPDVAPDGRTVAFVRNDLGQSRLAFLDLDTREVTEVAPLDAFQQVFSPDWSPDGRYVAYSGWREGGYRDIHIYDRRTGETRRITHSRAMDTGPEWTPDGRFILFSSDRSQGVVNLHAYELESERSYQVTNVLGGAFEATVSHDGSKIAYVGFASMGYDLWLMPFDPSKWTPAMPDELLRPLADDPTPEIPADRGRPPSQTSHRYQPWRTFYPRTLMPSALEFRSTSDFLTGLSLTTQIEDWASRHVFAGQIEYLPTVNRVVGAASYSYNRLFPNLSFSLSHDYGEFGESFVRYTYDQPEEAFLGEAAYAQRGYRETVTFARARMSLPVVRSPDHNASFDLAYRFTHYRNLDDDIPIDPNAPAPALPETGNYAGIELGFDYSSLEGVRYAYRTNKGRSLGLSVAFFDPALGSDYRDLLVSGSYHEKIEMPWRGHQILGMRLATGYSLGGLRRRGSFGVSGLSSYQDVVRTVLNRGFFSETGRLRGYESNAVRGRHFAVLNTEYRIPIVDIDRGVGAVPLFLERILFVPFTDWGLAWSTPPKLSDLLGSVGASLIFDLNVGYGDPVRLKLQYARGLDEELGTNFFQAMVLSSF